ncbi:unnamed protein product [Effrenium voratum]|nr:unnamed protein product [Effrenium voratum]
MGRSPPPFFPGAGRTPAREMRRFARPGRGRHDLGGLCGHGAGTSRDLTARSTALTRPAWSANSADAKTASAQFCWRCGELIRQGRGQDQGEGLEAQVAEHLECGIGGAGKPCSRCGQRRAVPAPRSTAE